MASTSGSVVTSPEQRQRSLTLTWSQTSQSIANNTTTISWTLKGSGSDSIYYYVTCRKIKVTINGTQAWYNAGEIDVNNQQVIATGTFNVPHNTDGTKTFTIAVEAAIYEVAVNSTGSGSWTLATIPRYATVSQSVSSKTETTITMYWSSDSTVDYIWYKIGNSGWNGIDVADGKSGTYTITGRSANTAYTIYTRVRRKDSQLTTDSSGLSVTTYSYPYASSIPNFNIGNDVTITVYNPLSRSITLRMKGADNSTIATKTLSGTSVKGFNTTAIQNALYASIPNSASGTYKIECDYALQTQTRTGGTYTALAANCKPSIGSASYVDANATTIAITGDASKIVRTLSQVTFTGSSCAAQKSASVSSVSVSVNGSTYAMTLSEGTATKAGVTINSGTNVTATITVTDSRGFTASASVTVTMINWQLPTGIISLNRHDNYYSETDLKCDATWTSVGSNTCTITYQCRVQGTESWTITGTLADNVTSEISLDNQFAWDVWIILTDSFGGTTTYKLQLSRGMPIAFFDRLRNAVGINCFPAEDNVLELSEDSMMRGVIAGLQTENSASSTPKGNVIVPLPRLSTSQVGAASTKVEDYLPAWLRYICSTHSGYNRCRFVGTGLVDVSLYIDAMIYNTSTVDANGNPQYSFGEALVYGGSTSYGCMKYRFGTANYIPYVFQDTLKTVTKTATVAFSAGTIGTRGFQTSWASSAIGGTPVSAQITHISASNEYNPIVFLEGTTVYLNAYRAVSTAVSNRSVTVEIFYK